MHDEQPPLPATLDDFRDALHWALTRRARHASAEAGRALRTRRRRGRARQQKPTREQLETGRKIVRELVARELAAIAFSDEAAEAFGAFEAEREAMCVDAGQHLVEAHRDALRLAVELLLATAERKRRSSKKVAEALGAALADAEDARAFADGVRRCMTCDVVQPLADFVPRPTVTYGGGIQRRCRSCVRDTLLNRHREE